MASWTNEVRSFLEARRVGRLATVGVDGTPHVVPVCYAVDATGLVLIADEKPKRRPAARLARLENLRRTPRAAVVVDDYDDDWSKLAWTMVRGPVVFLDDAPAHAAAVALLRARYPQYRAMALDDPRRFPVFRLIAERVNLWRAAWSAVLSAPSNRAVLPRQQVCKTPYPEPAGKTPSATPSALRAGRPSRRRHK